MGSGTVLKMAIEKYGIDKFDKEILYVFDNEEQMNNMEKEIVNEEFLMREDVYNLKKGGEGGFGYINQNKLSPCFDREHQIKVSGFIKMSKEKRTEIGILTKKLGVGVHSPENIKRITERNGFTGKTHNQNTKDKISKIKKIQQSGNKNSHYGHKWINKDGVNKSVKLDDLEHWISEGWVIGRKISV
jgi:hypothetical protein